MVKQRSGEPGLKPIDKLGPIVYTMPMDKELRTIQGRLGLGVIALAKMVGLDRHTMRGLLSGRIQYPKRETLEKLKAAFPGELDHLSYVHPMQDRARRRCTVHRCFRYAVSRGMCDKHYREVMRFGRVREPCEKRAPRGQGHLDRNGYIRAKNPTTGRQTFQHRIVMEGLLGRPLAEYENVHHKNGVRSDNRPENLELWVTCQPTGKRVEDMVSWCRWFLDQYETH